MASKIRINVTSAARFLNSLPVSHLDGVWHALESKMTELDLSPSRRARIAPEMSHAGQPSGNIRGIVAFVESADKDDADAVRTLHSTVAARMRAAGYKAKTDADTES